MWALLLPLLSQIPGVIGNFFKQKNEIESAKLEVQKQIELAKLELAGEIAKAETDRMKSSLAATGANFKYFTFFMWFGPFMVGTVYPTWAKEIFHNLLQMPDWYVQSCMLIMMTVWGIQVGSPVVSNMFSGLSSFMQGRREYKLELKKIDRKAYYEALRNTKGFVTPEDVQEMEPVFDKLDKESNQNG